MEGSVGHSFEARLFNQETSQKKQKTWKTDEEVRKFVQQNFSHLRKFIEREGWLVTEVMKHYNLEADRVTFTRHLKKAGISLNLTPERRIRRLFHKKGLRVRPELWSRTYMACSLGSHGGDVQKMSQDLGLYPQFLGQILRLLGIRTFGRETSHFKGKLRKTRNG